MSMRGVDVSHWNTGINLETLGVEFAIFKLTQGTSYTDNAARAFANQCVKAGLLYGCYHFADNGSAEAEAEHFYNEMKDDGLNGKALPVLDYEVSRANDRAWVERFVTRFYELTGIYPVIYTSASWCKKFNSSWVATKCALWVAGYPRKYTSWPDSDNIPYNIAPWSRAVIWQFSSSLKFNGVTGPVDGDFCYITRDEWQALAKGKNTAPVPAPANYSKIADEVIAGKWGNGSTRVIALEREGYNAKKVQELVNEKMSQKNKSVDELAREVIAGKWGNGAARKNALTGAGHDYTAVQARVNEIVKGDND